MARVKVFKSLEVPANHPTFEIKVKRGSAETTAKVPMISNMEQAKAIFASIGPNRKDDSKEPVFAGVVDALQEFAKSLVYRDALATLSDPLDDAISMALRFLSKGATDTKVVCDNALGGFGIKLSDEEKAKFVARVERKHAAKNSK